MDRQCARPGCAEQASATLTFDYAGQRAWLEELAATPSPATYDLCERHADRLSVPNGWSCDDRRPPPPPRALPPVGATAAAQRAIAV